MATLMALGKALPGETARWPAGPPVDSRKLLLHTNFFAFDTCGKELLGRLVRHICRDMHASW